MTTCVNHAAAIKRLDALFSDVSLDQNPPDEIVEVEKRRDKNCDTHAAKHGDSRRGSLGNILHANGNKRDYVNNNNNNNNNNNTKYVHRGYSLHQQGNGVGPRRGSVPALSVNNNGRRRDALNMPHVQKGMDHPSQFASSLRKDGSGMSSSSLRRDGTLGGPWHVGKRDTFGGSASSLRKDQHQHLQVPMRRNSKQSSTDSLDGRRNSWDPGRRGSAGSNGGYEEVRGDGGHKVFLG